MAGFRIGERQSCSAFFEQAKQAVRLAGHFILFADNKKKKSAPFKCTKKQCFTLSERTNVYFSGRVHPTAPTKTIYNTPDAHYCVFPTQRRQKILIATSFSWYARLPAFRVVSSVSFRSHLFWR
jgi:hypothetical protein